MHLLASKLWPGLWLCIFSLLAFNAHANEPSIPHELKSGECAHSETTSQILCREADGRYRIKPIADQSTPATLQKSDQAEISCVALLDETKNYQKFDEIAVKANLGEDSLDRIQVEVVGYLCRGTAQDYEDIRSLIDNGYVQVTAVERIANVLGKSYKTSPRSAQGKRFAEIRSGLLGIQLCSACADTLARVYQDQPGGRVARLVDAALRGDQKARQQLESKDFAFPVAPDQSPQADRWIGFSVVGFYTMAFTLFLIGLIKGVFRGPPNEHRKALYLMCGIMVGLPFLLVANEPLDPQIEACNAHWWQCRDNRQLVDHFKDVSEIQNACTRTASAEAKYGDPKLPWAAFTSFPLGVSMLETGMAYFVEKRAQYQNQFGAWENVSLGCSYDLNEHKVIGISRLDLTR